MVVLVQLEKEENEVEVKKTSEFFILKLEAVLRRQMVLSSMILLSMCCRFCRKQSSTDSFDSSQWMLFVVSV